MTSIGGLLGMAACVGIIYVGYKRKTKMWDAETAAASAAGGSSGDLSSVSNQVGRSIMSRKYDEGLAIINANIDKYQGEDRAQLLNQRAGILSIKGEHQAALPDYKEAYELDPSLTNLTNYVEVLVKLGMRAEAKPVAEQGLKNPNLRADDKKMLEAAAQG